MPSLSVTELAANFAALSTLFNVDPSRASVRVISVIPPSLTLARFAAVTKKFKSAPAITAPEIVTPSVEEPALKAFKLVPPAVANSAALIEMSVMPLAAILAILASTLVSLASTGSLIVTEPALMASSVNRALFACASVNVIDWIPFALIFTTAATAAVVSAAPVIVPSLRVTELSDSALA